jgi:ABC-type multidrug transport system permease subunit
MCEGRVPLSRKQKETTKQMIYILYILLCVFVVFCVACYSAAGLEYSTLPKAERTWRNFFMLMIIPLIVLYALIHLFIKFIANLFVIDEKTS